MDIHALAIQLCFYKEIVLVVKSKYFKENL